MKLIYRILIHLSLALPIILAAWGILFYMAIIDEVNDEVDDSLEDYSEVLITRALAGEQLPSQSDGSNNSYYLITVTADYAEKQKRIRYSDEMVHIEAKGETEPARVLRTIFKDKDRQYYELTVSTPTIEKARLTGSYSELDASPLFFASPAYSFGEYLGLLPEYASPLCATQMDGPIYDR